MMYMIKTAFRNCCASFIIESLRLTKWVTESYLNASNVVELGFILQVLTTYACQKTI